MSEFCFFVGVDLQPVGENNGNLFICNSPVMAHFGPLGASKILLFPIIEEHKGNPITANIYYYTEDIFKALINIIPEFKGKNIRSIFEENTGYIRDSWDDDKWDTSLEPIIVEIIIINLLKDGWSLFPKDGLWFVK